MSTRYLVLSCGLLVGLAGCDSSTQIHDSGSGQDSLSDVVGAADGGFSCGLGKCTKGQFCPAKVGCSGSPVPDSGLCSTGCTPCMQPIGTKVCDCSPPQCKQLPPGCSACSCLKRSDIPVGCKCVEKPGGEIRVECTSA